MAFVYSLTIGIDAEAGAVAPGTEESARRVEHLAKEHLIPGLRQSGHFRSHRLTRLLDPREPGLTWNLQFVGDDFTGWDAFRAAHLAAKLADWKEKLGDFPVYFFESQHRLLDEG